MSEVVKKRDQAVFFHDEPPPFFPAVEPAPSFDAPVEFLAWIRHHLLLLSFLFGYYFCTVCSRSVLGRQWTLESFLLAIPSISHQTTISTVTAQVRLTFTILRHKAPTILVQGSLSQRNIEHSRAGVDTSRQKIHGRKLSYGKSDERRNLYILGLPFSLTRTEFVALFSEHGIVSHAVILATVDNASRRRGFVVMSSHTEAKAALDALDGQQVKQHTLDVSWAVVQRSQGFLDGADRIVMLESPTPSSPSDESFSAPSENCNASPAVSNSNQPEQNGCTRTLVVSNLPISLFSHDSDLHPLFCPFGHVKSLKFSTLPALDWHSRPDTVLAVVEYANQTSAHEALTALNGQTYANYTIKVEYPPNAKSARFASTPPKLEPGSKYIPQGVSSSYFMLSPMFAPMSVNSEPFLVDTPTPNACVFPMINNINRTSLYALPITSYYSLGHGSGIHSAYAPQSYPQIPYFVPNASPITPAQGGFPGQSSASL